MMAIGLTIRMNWMKIQPVPMPLSTTEVLGPNGEFPGTRGGDRPSASRRGSIALIEVKEECHKEVGRRIGDE